MKLKIPCIDCKGTGIDPQPHGTFENGVYIPPVGVECGTCQGSGYFDQSITTEEVDAVSTYLITLREDLTVALAAIWNKVKDL
jgi:DnaJ-class molecular chaperone